jgi:hypothetical protein
MSILLAALQSNQFSSSASVNENDVRTGSVVVVRSGFGSESPETVTVLGFEYDGKNGLATIDYTDKSGDGRWAYLNQIQRVISY